MKPSILVFSGSTRSLSLNGRLARIGAAAVEAAGGRATSISLLDFSLPLYNGDLEISRGIPAEVMELKHLFKEHHGFLIASPEYNASVSPLLKNTIDWISRPTRTEHGKAPYKGKVAALMSVTPSAFAGARGLAHLRQILTALGTWVVPDQLGIADANAFNAKGGLSTPAHAAALSALVDGLVRAAGRMASVETTAS